MQKIMKSFSTIFILILLISCNNTLNKVKGKTFANKETESIVTFKGKTAYLVVEGMEIGIVELAAKYKNKLVYAKRDFYHYVYVFISERETLYFAALTEANVAAIGGIKNLETIDCIPLKLVEKDK